MNYYSAYRLLMQNGLVQLDKEEFSNYICPNCRRKIFYKGYQNLKPLIIKDVLVNVECPICNKMMIKQ